MSQFHNILEKPDLIFIITDQERATQHFPDNWEQENLKTLTFLKQNGFSFDRAFCNTCMCSPSRSTWLTGVYPAQHNVSQTLTTGGDFSTVETTLNNQTPNIARILQPLGYDVQYRGKWHVSKGADSGDPYGNVTPEDVALFGFRGWVGPDAGEDSKPENFGGGFANHDSKYITQAIKFLQGVKERRSKGDKTPYCLILSLVNPHDVLAYPNGVQYGYYPEQYTQRGIDLPSTWNENLLANKKPMAQEQVLISADGMLGVLKDEDMKLNYINFYGYLLRQIDAEIGTVVAEVYKPFKPHSEGLIGQALDFFATEQRLADSAIIFRIADHGEMGMAHGGMRQKAFVAYEEALRIPFVISNPVLFPNSGELKSTNNLATLIDVVPTICDLLGVTPPTDIRGVSLMPVLSGQSVQDSFLFTYDDTKAGANNQGSAVKAANRVRAIRTNDYKFSYYFDALGSYEHEYELYDLNADPDEVTNQAYNPQYAEIRAKLYSQLKELEQSKLLVHTGSTFTSKNWVTTNPNTDDFAYNSLDTESTVQHERK